LGARKTGLGNHRPDLGFPEVRFEGRIRARNRAGGTQIAAWQAGRMDDRALAARADLKADRAGVEVDDPGLELVGGVDAWRKGRRGASAFLGPVEWRRAMVRR
jgi:hypothetical protein